MVAATKRARSPEARAERRSRILDAAEGLFADQRFSELRVSRVARELGLAKGTLYLYFASKESLFLAVVQRSLDAWFDDVFARLSNHAFIDEDSLARELTESLASRPELVRLLALQHAVLEENIGEQDAVEFKSFLAKRMKRVGLEIERLLPTLEVGEGVRLLLHVHSLVVGIRQLSDPPPVVEGALERPELYDLRMDFKSELSLALSALFRGFGAASLSRRNVPA